MSQTVLSAPTSDQERLNHLAQWHGLPQYTVREWRLTFPKGPTPKEQHRATHESGKVRNHRHVRGPIL